MSNIRISALPSDAAPSQSDVVPVDGATTRKVTLADFVAAARPLASQAEAEAGVESTKAMTSLTTKQAITVVGAGLFATTAQGAKADTAVQPAQSIPAGGLTGQVLAKTSASDYATQWQNAGAGDVLSSNNLSDLSDIASARSNLKSVTFVADSTALAALDGAKDKVAVVYNAGTKNGTFQWVSSDLSSYVTTDTHKAIYVPPASDTTGASGAWVRMRDLGLVNMDWFGVDKTGAIDCQAEFASAIALTKLVPGGTLYIPAGTYKTVILIQDYTGGITVKGDGFKHTIINQPSGAPSTFQVIGSTSSGQVSNVHIRDLHVTGPSGTPSTDVIAVNIFNCINFTLKNLEVFGTTGIRGSQGGGAQENLWLYGNPALYLGTSDNTVTAAGQLEFVGGQYTCSNATEGSTPAVHIVNNVIADFRSIMFEGARVPIVVQIDGGASSSTSSVNFYDCHAESCGSTDGTCAIFDIGNVAKFGHVGIYGGNWFGHGDGSTYHCADFVRVSGFGCSDLVVDGCIISNLGSTGFTTAAVRIDATGWPGANDKYTLKFPKPLNSITPYSDSNGTLGYFTGDESSAHLDRLYTGTGSVTNSFTDITFGMTFKTAPSVWVQPIGGASAAATQVGTITTTQFSSYSSVNPTTIRWFAYGTRVA